MAAPSNAGPAAKPPKPLLVMAMGGPGGTANVSWTPGMGGGVPTSYAVLAFEMNFGYTSTATACGTCRNAVVTGLIGSRMYTFIVYAQNATGASAGAQSLPTMIPGSVPTAPQDVRVEGRESSLRVGWVPPVNEGAALRSYSVAVVDVEGAVVSAASACGTCTSAFVGNLTNGESYRAVVAAVNSHGAGPPATSSNAADATSVPSAIVDASATPIPGGFTVSWDHDAGTATPPDFFIVQAFGFDSFSQWFACGTCDSLTMAPLPQNRTYDLKVYPHNSAGYGQGPTVTVTTGSGDCEGAALCAEVDATKTLGQAKQPAQGLLNGYIPGTSNTLLNGLNLKQWRVSPSSGAHLQAETMPDVSITSVLSDAWRSSVAANGKYQAPWANWPRYESFVKQFVQQTENQGRKVDYWDIQNEPLPGAYNAGPPPTTELWYEQYRVTYNAIKSVDPDAKIIAPSLGQMLWTSSDRNAPNALDVPGFMAYSDARDLHFDAYSWHELGINQPGYFDSPQRVIDDMQAARTALAMHPNLGTPKFFINEYQPATTYLIPGQIAGFLTALDQSNVDQANTTCHEYTYGPGYRGCSFGTLNGMLLQDHVTPRGTYWVRQQYGNMTGQRLATSSTNPAVTAFATNPAAGTYQVMVSRHQTCVKSINVYCNQGAAATPASAPVTVKLRTAGTTTATVDVRMVPVGVDALPAPVDVTDFTSSTADGVTTVTLPPVADGDVYLLTFSY